MHCLRNLLGPCPTGRETMPLQLMRTQRWGFDGGQGKLPRRNGSRKRRANRVDGQTSWPMGRQNLPPLSCRGRSTRGRRWRSSVWWPPLWAAKLRKRCHFGRLKWSTDPKTSPVHPSPTRTADVLCNFCPPSTLSGPEPPPSQAFRNPAEGRIQ